MTIRLNHLLRRKFASHEDHTSDPWITHPMLLPIEVIAGGQYERTKKLINLYMHPIDGGINAGKHHEQSMYLAIILSYQNLL